MARYAPLITLVTVAALGGGLFLVNTVGTPPAQAPASGYLQRLATSGRRPGFHENAQHVVLSGLSDEIDVALKVLVSRMSAPASRKPR